MVFYDPDVGVAIEPKGAGHQVLPISLEPVANEMRRAAERLRDRPAGQIGQVTRNRHVVHNAWVVAGTRIPTSAIWNFHEARYATDDIISEYPRLTRADVQELSISRPAAAQPHKALLERWIVLCVRYLPSLRPRRTTEPPTSEQTALASPLQEL